MIQRIDVDSMHLCVFEYVRLCLSVCLYVCSQSIEMKVNGMTLHYRTHLSSSAILDIDLNSVPATFICQFLIFPC